MPVNCCTAWQVVSRVNMTQAEEAFAGLPKVNRTTGPAEY